MADRPAFTTGTSHLAARPGRTTAAALGLVLVGMLVGLAGCGSSSGGATGSTATAAGERRPSATTTPSSGTTPDSAAPATGAAVGMRGKRYCEVLLLDVVDGNASAAVFNSYPLNDCPEQQWRALDAKAIAAADAATLAVLNGPRYWLMDRIEKQDAAGAAPRDFGGIEMIQRATVDVGPLAEAMTPYTPRAVNRSTVFTFDAGQTVYELTAPGGSVYVMQAWSQQKDPTLTEADLAGLGSRLALPAGWAYASRTLTEPLRVDTTTAAAQVLQDELGNSYSLVTTASGR